MLFLQKDVENMDELCDQRGRVKETRHEYRKLCIKTRWRRKALNICYSQDNLKTTNQRGNKK